MSVTPQLVVSFDGSLPGPTYIAFQNSGESANGGFIVAADFDGTGLLSAHWTALISSIVSAVEGISAINVTSQLVTVSE
jgi:hypothetical protein